MPWAAIQAGRQTLAALATGLQQVIAAKPAMHHSAQRLSSLSALGSALSCSPEDSCLQLCSGCVSRHWTLLAFCRCRLLALDCQNQLPCNGIYPCAATFLVGRHVLTEGKTLRFSEAKLQVTDSTLELQLPSPADLPGCGSLTVHIEI